MKDFRKLMVWQKAHELTLSVYQDTTSFPVDERFGLTSQLRRASASIAANIAEGCGRDGDAELERFLTIATGSASEVEYHLLLARDLELLAEADDRRNNEQICELKRMLASLIQKLKTDRKTKKQKADR